MCTIGSNTVLEGHPCEDYTLEYYLRLIDEYWRYNDFIKALEFSHVDLISPEDGERIGNTARQAGFETWSIHSEHLNVGDKVQLMGRFQSRAYQKQLADGTILNKTAYEVSVGRLSMADTIVQPSSPFVIRQGVREDAPLHYETVATDSGFLSNPQ